MADRSTVRRGRYVITAKGPLVRALATARCPGEYRAIVEARAPDLLKQVCGRWRAEPRRIHRAQSCFVACVTSINQCDVFAASAQMLHPGCCQSKTAISAPKTVPFGHSTCNSWSFEQFRTAISPSMSRRNVSEVRQLATAARSKLQQAADQPDHCLRRLCGHANMLDGDTPALARRCCL